MLVGSEMCIIDRLHSIIGVEASSRRFFPASTQEAEKAVHRGIFAVSGVESDTSSLRGTGLGYQIDKMRAAGWTP